MGLVGANSPLGAVAAGPSGSSLGSGRTGSGRLRAPIYTPAVDQSDPDGPEQPAVGDGVGPPPEFLNPESPRYQPWAEKQITNAVKEKRPLEEFLAEFDARVATYGLVESGSWDPQHNERLLARFSSAVVPGRKRRRRRPAGPGAGSPRAVPGQIPPPVPGPPAAANSEAGVRSERRRRRRRRPRGGRRPPEAGAGG